MTTTATGKRTDAYFIEATERYRDIASQLARLTGVHLSGMSVVDGEGYPTFTVRLTAPQAAKIAAALGAL